jgi:hypothetical protein
MILERDIWMRNTKFLFDTGLCVLEQSLAMNGLTVSDEATERATIANDFIQGLQELSLAQLRREEQSAWFALGLATPRIALAALRAARRPPKVATADGALGQTLFAGKRCRLVRDLGTVANEQESDARAHRGRRQESPSGAKRQESPPRCLGKTARSDGDEGKPAKVRRTHDMVVLPTSFAVIELSDADIKRRTLELDLHAGDWITCAWTAKPMTNRRMFWRGVVQKQSRYTSVRWTHVLKGASWIDLRRDGAYITASLPSHEESLEFRKATGGFHVLAISRCPPPPGEHAAAPRDDSRE